MATPEGNRAVVERMLEFVGLPLDASTLKTLLGASPSNVRAIQQPMDKATREQLVRFYGEVLCSRPPPLPELISPLFARLPQRHITSGSRSYSDGRCHGTRPHRLDHYTDQCR
jgi:hypothetical protein